MTRSKLLFSGLSTCALLLGLLPVAFASTSTGYPIINETPYVLTVQVGVAGNQHGNFYCKQNGINYENFFTVPPGGSCNIGYTSDYKFARKEVANGTIQMWYGYYPECDVNYNRVSSGVLQYNYLSGTGGNCLPASRENVTLTNNSYGGITVAINNASKAGKLAKKAK